MEKERSQFRLLRFHNLIILASLLIIFSIIFILFNQDKQIELVIYDQDTGDEYIRTEVERGDEFVVQWEHSVEKELWQEKLKINEDGDIVLIETRFRSFGAGVPSSKDEGNVYFENGFLVMTDLQEVKNYYQWIHSHKAKFMIFKNDEPFLLTTDIPHHHKAEMIVKKG